MRRSIKSTFASTGLGNQVRERAIAEAAKLAQKKNDEAAANARKGLHQPGRLAGGKVVPSRISQQGGALSKGASSASAAASGGRPAKSKKIRAYGNGAPIDGKGPEVVVVSTLEALLTSATKRLSLNFGARCLYLLLLLLLPPPPSSSSSLFALLN